MGPQPSKPSDAAQQVQTLVLDQAQKRNLLKAQSLARGWLARKRYAALVKDARRRAQIVQELLDTERGYVTHMECVVDLFLRPLAQSRLIPKKDHDTIFSCCEEILQSHRLLLATLTDRIEGHWTPHQRIGDLFVEFAPTLPRFYKPFINNFPNASSEFKRLIRKGGKFAAFVEKTQSDPRCRRLGFLSLYVTPIQRIPRYVMMLSDLHRHMPDDHPDRGDLLIALDNVKAIADEINEGKRDAETEIAIKRIEESMAGKYEPLTVEGRSFMREGPLGLRVKRKSVVDSADAGEDDGSDLHVKKRQVFLFNDSILLAGFNRMASVQGKKYNFKMLMPLNGARVDELKGGDDSSGWPFGLWPTEASSEPYILIAERRRLRQQWIQHIRHQISFLMVRELAGGDMPAAHAAAVRGHRDGMRAVVDLDRSAIMKKDKRGRTPFHYAAEGGHATICRYVKAIDPSVMDTPDEEGLLPIHLAAKSGMAQVVDMLIAGGANPSQTDEFGRTALLFSIEFGHKSVYDYLLGAAPPPSARTIASPSVARDDDVLAKAIQAVVDAESGLSPTRPLPKVRTDATDVTGWSVLAKAAYLGDHDAVKALCKAGANPRLKGLHGRTPLHLAAEQGEVAVCAVLLSYGAQPNAVDEVGETPMHYADHGGHVMVMQLLAKNGGRLDLENDFGKISLDASIPKEWITTINASAKEYTDLKGPKTGTIPDESDKSLSVPQPIVDGSGEYMKCKICRSPYSIAKRRHRCRSCRLSVCDACSHKRHPLPDSKGQAMRVCDGCFLSLRRIACAEEQLRATKRHLESVRE